MWMNVLDWVFVGAGFLMCCICVGLIVIIQSFRPRPSLIRAEPVLAPHWDVPPAMAPRDEWHAVSSSYKADLMYPGFTGMIHVHGVENGDTFRAMVTDNGAKCRIEKMVRVRV